MVRYLELLYIPNISDPWLYFSILFGIIIITLIAIWILK